MSRIRANLITNQSADGAPTVQNGLVVSGVITATTLKGDGSQLTGIDATSLKDSAGNVKVQATSTGAVLTGILTASGRVGVGTNTTAERNSLTDLAAGQFVMNVTTGLMEYYNGTAWTPIDTPPTVTSVNNTNITETQIDSGFDLVVTGTNFKTGAVCTFIGNDGTEHISPTTTVNTTTQITTRVHSSVSNTNEPYDVKIANPSGLSGILEDAFNINAKPIWSTASGTLATILDSATGTHATVAASDPEGDAITYSGTVGGGMSLNSSTGAITGDPTDVNSDTTVSFTIDATSSGSNTTSRNFNIIVQPGPITDNLQVWFDPRKFSSLSNGATCTSNTASILPNTSWQLNTSGTPSYVSGTSSQAIETSSGTLGFLTYNQDITAFDNVDNYTFEFWVYIGAQDIGSWGFIGGKSRFWTDNDGGIFILSDGSSWGFHTSSNGNTYDMPANGWYQVVFVRNLSDSNCRKLYVNNSLALQDNVGDNNSDHTLNNNTPLTVGCSSADDGTSFSYSPGNGFKWGHARFYTKSLSTTEIAKNWNATKSVYGL